MAKDKKSKLLCEVVRVASQGFLVNSRLQARCYETCDGKPLALGYYLVLRPVGACLDAYRRESRYIGPVATHSAAVLLQISAVELGVVEKALDPLRAAAPVPSPAPMYPPLIPSCGAVTQMAAFEGNCL